MSWVSFGLQAAISLASYASKALADGEIRLSEVGQVIGGAAEDLGVGVTYDVGEGELRTEVERGAAKKREGNKNGV